MLATNGETCTVEIGNRQVNFRSTCVRPYYRDNTADIPEITDLTDDKDDNAVDPTTYNNNRTTTDPRDNNNYNTITVTPTKRPHGQPRKTIYFTNNTPTNFNNFLNRHFFSFTTFLSAKEKADRELLLKLRAEGKIKIPGALFKASAKKEINYLIKQEIIRFIKYNPNIKNERIFGLRLINKVKGKATDKLYKKIKLVI